MAAQTYPYPTARSNAMRPAKRGTNGRSRAGQGHGNRCQWCGRKLAGRQQSVCSASHRSQLSRCKHRTAVRALTDLGMSRHVADRLIGAVGLAAVEDKLNALGWRWQPAARAWVNERENGLMIRRAA